MDEVSLYRADREQEFRKNFSGITAPIHHFELRGRIMPLSPGWWKIVAVLATREELVLTEGDFLTRGWYGAYHDFFRDLIRGCDVEAPPVTAISEPY